MKLFRIIFVVSILVSLVACAPTTFIRTMDPGWNSVELREGVNYDDAWKSIVDLIAKSFDIEVISKEDGYIRTGWLYSWTGDLTESYKVRAIIKFSPKREKVEIKSEANYYSSGFMGVGKGWEMGTDERLITTLRTDIMGKVGRVTR
jgi:hypothetical protein